MAEGQYQCRHDHSEHESSGLDRYLLHGSAGGLKQAVPIIQACGKDIDAKSVAVTEAIAKVSLIGVGMRSHSGVAAKMFEVLSREGINIMMISTSEIKISCVIDEKYLELAMRALHSAFELDQISAPALG